MEACLGLKIKVSLTLRRLLDSDNPSQDTACSPLVWFRIGLLMPFVATANASEKKRNTHQVLNGFQFFKIRFVRLSPLPS